MLTSLAAFDSANMIYFFKLVTLMRRSTVLSLPLQLVFLAPSLGVAISASNFPSFEKKCRQQRVFCGAQPLV